MWKIVDTKHGKVILPEEPLLCPFCGTEMLLHDFKCVRQVPGGFFHCDVHVKCPKCSFWATFGVPVTKEIHDELTKSPLHGKIIREELSSLVTGKVWDRVAERLKRWGYW